jgi:hypothetical protein
MKEAHQGEEEAVRTSCGNVVMVRHATRTTLFTTSNLNARATTSVRVGEGGYRNQHHEVGAYAIMATELSVHAPPFQLRLNDKDDDD